VIFFLNDVNSVELCYFARYSIQDNAFKILRPHHTCLCRHNFQEKGDTVGESAMPPDRSSSIGKVSFRVNVRGGYATGRSETALPVQLALPTRQALSGRGQADGDEIFLRMNPADLAVNADLQPGIVVDINAD